LIAKQVKAVQAEHDMMQHTYAEQVASLFEPPRNVNVFRTRRRLAAWVIVNQHHGSSAKMKRRSPLFAGCTSDAVRLPVDITLKPFTRFLLFMASNTKCSLSASSVS
jgi:hypothetical protein